MPYRAPVEEYKFLFDHVIGLADVTATDRFSDATPDMTAAILSEAARMCEEVLYPLQRPGDLNPARLENGVVRTAPGFADGYRAIATGGWVSISAHPDHGGAGLPMTLTAAVNEMMSQACLPLQLAPLLTQGQIEALEHHASDAIKDIYLPKLVSGDWTGTMNLTESQAGSDVGAVRTRAEDQGDGTYAITGQKIYISWGDHDMAENVCHLVLARLPEGSPGTKGISLFLVPKFIPDEGGNPGVRNDLKVVSLEHKMGLHASPTCVMQYEGATGWLVGEAHQGMRAMFTMMNNARLGVGGQGIGVAEAAYQQALAFAQDRKQGRTPDPENPDTIIGHANVRRMLAGMKSEILAARATALACAQAIDMETATGAKHWAARAALLTPIAKVCGTETGISVANTGIQLHGGMGYVEETGAAQYLRDVRVTAIYEGTNGIQAMDLVGRKLMDGGEAAFTLIDEIQSAAEAARDDLPKLADPVWQAAETLREATDWMLGKDDMTQRFAGAMPFLRGFARVLGGHYHLKSARAEGGAGTRTRLAQFYIKRLLPEHAGHLAHAAVGSDDLYALTAEDLAA
jgi:alkylation response protein AidB-like acyl-CoA dehydrogenase